MLLIAAPPLLNASRTLIDTAFDTDSTTVEAWLYSTWNSLSVERPISPWHLHPQLPGGVGAIGRALGKVEASAPPFSVSFPRELVLTRAASGCAVRPCSMPTVAGRGAHAVGDEADKPAAVRVDRVDVGGIVRAVAR